MPLSFPIALLNGRTYLSMVLDTFVLTNRWNCILDLWRPLGDTNTFSQALSSATFINDLGVIPYPENIKTPNPNLNISASPGKFRYDRDFLLQFMNVCKEKPDSFPSLEDIGLKPYEKAAGKNANDNRRIGSKGMGGAPSTSRQASMGLGLGPGLVKGGGFAISQFQSPTRRMDSQPRFDASNDARVPISFAGPANTRLTMTRGTLQGGVGTGGLRETKRTQSQRGNNRGEGWIRGSGFQAPSPQLGGMNLEPVAPLEVSENRWVAGSAQRTIQLIEEYQLVQRKVTALLNKLTMTKFDSISDQIIAYANLSEQEKDGSTLMQVIKLVFEKAKDEEMFSEMYARLCRKMMERVSPNVQDETIRSSDGQPIAGGMLFRKYLLNRCQEDFERGCSAKEAALAAAKSKADDDKAAEAANEAISEAVLYSDEYYAAAKAKRQGLGLCIKKLLSNAVNPEEEEIESLCKLLTTVGHTLDNPKARNHMDIYFERMNEMAKGNNLKPRMQFMLLDVVELRSRQWHSRSGTPPPQRHDKGNRHLQRGGSRRGERREMAEPAGWNVAGGASTRPPGRAGDLSQFGKISKPTGIQFGPTSVFSKKEPKREASIGRTGGANMFATLSRGGGAPMPTPMERTSSCRKPIFGGAHGTREKRKLNLAPRIKPLENKEEEKEEDKEEDKEEALAPAALSEADAKKKVEEDTKASFH